MKRGHFTTTPQFIMAPGQTQLPLEITFMWTKFMTALLIPSIHQTAPGSLDFLLLVILNIGICLNQFCLKAQY